MSQFKKLIRLPPSISPPSVPLRIVHSCQFTSLAQWAFKSAGNNRTMCEMTSSTRIDRARTSFVSSRYLWRNRNHNRALLLPRAQLHSPLPLSLGIYIPSLPLFQCCFGLFIGFHFVFLLLFLFYASEFAAFISHRTHLRRATIIGSLLGGSCELSLSLSLALFTLLLYLPFSHSCSGCLCLFPSLALSLSWQVRWLLTLLIVVLLHLTALYISGGPAQLAAYPLNTFTFIYFFPRFWF